MTRAVRPRTLRRIASRERQRGYLGLNSYRRLAASALSGPSFAAGLLTSIVPDKAAPGTAPTFTRATTKTFTDWEGVLRTALAGEACFTGARRVYNRVQQTSEDFTNAAWVKTTCTVIAGAVDPLGGTTAYTITATAGNGLVNNGSGPTALGNTCVSSMWIRRRTGTGVIALFAGGTAAIDVTAAVTSTWQRISVISTATDGSLRCAIRLTTSGDAVDLWHAQGEDVTGQSNQNPSEYVSVGVLSAPFQGANVDGVQYFATQNGNTVASNVVTAGTSAAIASSVVLGYDAWQAATNLALQSTFAATWTVSNATLTANAAVGPDGTSTAATLTEAAATSTHVTLQSFTKAASALAYTMTVWAKAGLRSQIGIALDNGSASAGIVCFFNLSNGTPGTPGAGGTYVTTLFTGASVSMTAFPNGWYRCRLTATTDTGTTLRVQIMPSDGGGTLSYVGTAGSGVSIFGAQLEQNAFATPYIPTTTAAVTRNADALTYPSSGNLSAAAASVYCESSQGWANAAISGTPAFIGNFNATGMTPLGFQASSGKLFIFDNTAVRAGSAFTASATPQKIASAWSGTVGATCLAGVVTATPALSGTQAINTAIGVGCDGSGTSGFINGNIRNVRIWTRALTDAQLQAMTT